MKNILAFDEREEEEEDLQINKMQLEDSEESNCKCDHYKAILNMNGLAINALSKE